MIGVLVCKAKQFRCYLYRHSSILLTSHFVAFVITVHLGSVVGVYNGKQYITVEIKPVAAPVLLIHGLANNLLILRC